MDYEIYCNDEVALGCLGMDYEICCNDQVAFGSSIAFVSCSMSISFVPSSSVFSFLFVFFGWIMKFIEMMG